MPLMPQDYEIHSVIEEIHSLANVSKIEYECHLQITLDFVKVIKSILSRPSLKQISFAGAWHFSDSRFDTEEEFPKNCNVEEIEIEFDFHFFWSFEFWNKLFDALPNIKKVQIFNRFHSDNVDIDFENLPVFLKNISGLKHLKSLNVKIMCYHNFEYFDAQKFGHILEIIKNNFPMNSEVTVEFIGRMNTLIEKKEGENPKIVNGLVNGLF